MFGSVLLIFVNFYLHANLKITEQRPLRIVYNLCPFVFGKIQTYWSEVCVPYRQSYIWFINIVGVIALMSHENDNTAKVGSLFRCKHICYQSSNYELINTF